MLTFSIDYVIIMNMDAENQKMPKKVTIKDIAKFAGVSVSTVSRALRNDPTASPKTIKRILKILTLPRLPDFVFCVDFYNRVFSFSHRFF